MKIYISQLEDKKIAYTNETEFIVQIGTGKNSYKTKAVFVGKLISAFQFYKDINLEDGQKKRLLMPSSKKSVLARQIS